MKTLLLGTSWQELSRFKLKSLGMFTLACLTLVQFMPKPVGSCGVASSKASVGCRRVRAAHGNRNISCFFFFGKGNFAVDKLPSPNSQVQTPKFMVTVANQTKASQCKRAL